MRPLLLVQIQVVETQRERLIGEAERLGLGCPFAIDPERRAQAVPEPGPQVAGWSPEAFIASYSLFLDNLRLHLAGQPVRTPL